MVKSWWCEHTNFIGEEFATLGKRGKGKLEGGQIKSPRVTAGVQKKGMQTILQTLLYGFPNISSYDIVWNLYALNIFFYYVLKHLLKVQRLYINRYIGLCNRLLHGWSVISKAISSLLSGTLQETSGFQSILTDEGTNINCSLDLSSEPEYVQTKHANVLRRKLQFILVL